MGSRETQDMHDSAQRSRVASGSSRPSQGVMGTAALGRTPLDFCQGRVLVVLSPAPSGSGGSAREVFVTRAATEDCSSAAGCSADVCRTALEHSLVDILERRF